MSRTKRKFTREFKVAAVKRLQSGSPVRVARELKVNPNQHSGRPVSVRSGNYGATSGCGSFSG